MKYFTNVIIHNNDWHEKSNQYINKDTIIIVITFRSLVIFHAYINYTNRSSYVNKFIDFITN